MTNLFTSDLQDKSQEHFETLLQTPKLTIEKIISNGQTSSQWYEQDHDEWVVLIEGEGRLLFDNEEEIHLNKGEHLFIPKRRRHKVSYTASPTIWLAIHF